MAVGKRILIVDDDERNRKLLAALVQSFGHESETAKDGIEALAKLKLEFDLVLLDIQMPAMDGFEVVRRIRQDPATADLPVVMQTAFSERESRLRAVEAGANDFVGKPIDKTELRLRMESLLKMKEARDQLKRHEAELETIVQKRTATLRATLDEMVDAQRNTYDAQLETIRRLALVAEFKDKITATHLDRMSRYSALLAEGLHMPPGEVDLILHASPLHDVGKVGIPDAVLQKPGKLDAEEWKIMKQHTVIGHKILSGSRSPLLQTGAVIAISHHEKWDGNGYPNGLAGEDIPLYGRIIAVADAFDAMTTKRQYKEAFPNEVAYDILRKDAGKHFDPHVIEVFFGLLDRCVEIQARFSKPDGEEETAAAV